MLEFPLFAGVSEVEFKKVCVCFNARKLNFKKEQNILSNIKKVGTVGIILSGEAQLIKYDYQGKRTILEDYSMGDVFGDTFSNISSGEISVIASKDSEVLFMDYDKIINRCKKNCMYHNTIIQNMMMILSKKIYDQNERIEILSQRSIRDKLLEYLNNKSKRNNSKTIYLPFSFTDLADYLSIDRASMMREIKNMKDDGLLKTNGRIIHILY